MVDKTTPSARMRSAEMWATEAWDSLKNGTLDHVVFIRAIQADALASRSQSAALAIVNEQAEDESLWFKPVHITEDILQRALRRLHEAVEGKTQEECAVDTILKAVDGALNEMGYAKEQSVDEVPMLNEKYALNESVDEDVKEVSHALNCPDPYGAENKEAINAFNRLLTRVGSSGDVPEGWVIPLSSMTELAQETFHKMMLIISHGGSVDVVARCDGKDYRWQCDGLKYAKLFSDPPAIRKIKS